MPLINPPESEGRPSGGKSAMWLSIGLFIIVVAGGVIVYIVRN
jgi:hypothetical protein